jgi:hypothetical protein
LDFRKLGSPRAGNPPNFGTPILVADIDQFLKAHHHIKWQRNPNYVEFDMTALIAFAADMKNKISVAEEVPSDYKCRVYFTTVSKYDCLRTGLVLATAKKTVDIVSGETFYVDQTDIVYDVGSPCPPDCKNGGEMSDGRLAARLAEFLRQEEQECLRDATQCGCKPV